MTTAIDELDARLQRAVAFTLRSDVPVGIFLSAGIDSSLVARAAVKAGTVARAFSLGFEEQSHSEIAGARQTAAKLGLPITEVTLNASALERFTNLVAHADDPLADSSALAVWTLSAETAKHVKVVLAGDGGDELFGGYLTYPATLWHASVTSRLPMVLRRAMAAAGSRIGGGDGKVTTAYKLMRYLRAMPLPPGEAHFSWNGTWLPEEAASLAADAEAKAAARDSLRWMAERHGLTGGVTLGTLQRADVARLPGQRHPRQVRSDVDGARVGSARAVSRSRAGRICVAPAGVVQGRAPRSRKAPAARACETHVWPRDGRRDQAGLQHPGPRMAPRSGATARRRSAVGLVDGVACRCSKVPSWPRAVDDHMSGRRALGWELWGLMVLSAWHRQQIQRVPAAPDAPRPDVVSIPFAS